MTEQHADNPAAGQPSRSELPEPMGAAGRGIKLLQDALAPTEEFYDEHLVYQGAPRNDDLQQLITFILDDEEYAFELSGVTEVIKMRDITDVPYAPSFIPGIISLRGEIMPVMSLHRRLGLNETGATPETRMLVISNMETRMAVIVDRIIGVVKVRETDIEPAPPLPGGAAVDFIKGSAHYRDNLVILLKLPLLFNFEGRTDDE